MTLFELSREVARLCTEKNFAEALNTFRNSKAGFSNAEIGKNSFLVKHLLTALRHTGNARYASIFLSMFGVVPASTTDQWVLNAYGWCLYDELKAMLGEQEEEGLMTADEEDDDLLFGTGTVQSPIAELSFRIRDFLILKPIAAEEFTYTVSSSLWKSLLKWELRRPGANQAFLMEIVDLTGPDRLSDHCFSFEKVLKGKEKTIEMASDRETWFAVKTRILFSMGDYNACAVLCQQALESFSRFHFSNDVWFTRRLAQCHLRTGSPEEALKQLLLVLKRKDEWYIHKEVADLFASKFNYNEALRHCYRGLSGPGELSFKVNLLHLTGEVLSHLHKEEEGYMHWQLELLVRKEEGWSVTSQLREIQSRIPAHIREMNDGEKLLQRLNGNWQSALVNEKMRPKESREKGKVVKILNDSERGVDGFIVTGNNEQIYFSISRTQILPGGLRVGSVVSFFIGDGKNGRKRARGIRVENN